MCFIMLNLLQFYAVKTIEWADHVTGTYKFKIAHKILAIEREEERHLTDWATSGIGQDKAHFDY
jgi:hypothetical protein